MDSRQRLIDDVARQCGPSVVALNLDEVQACARSSPMVTSHPRGAFTDIDRSADPGGFVQVLDALTALDFIRAYKRRTFELLDLQPGDRVLDLGCGTGEDVQELARLVGPSGRVVGVDRSETVIAEARERVLGTTFRSRSRWRMPTRYRSPMRPSMPAAPTGSSTTWSIRARRSANSCA